jgi:hypothetical protein
VTRFSPSWSSWPSAPRRLGKRRARTRWSRGPHHLRIFRRREQKCRRRRLGHLGRAHARAGGVGRADLLVRRRARKIVTHSRSPARSPRTARIPRCSKTSDAARPSVAHHRRTPTVVLGSYRTCGVLFDDARPGRNGSRRRGGRSARTRDARLIPREQLRGPLTLAMEVARAPGRFFLRSTAAARRAGRCARSRTIPSPVHFVSTPLDPASRGDPAKMGIDHGHAIRSGEWCRRFGPSARGNNACWFLVSRNDRASRPP